MSTEIEILENLQKILVEMRDDIKDIKDIVSGRYRKPKRSWDRVLRSIYILGRKENREIGNELVTTAELAGHIGISREVVGRHLDEMEREGYYVRREFSARRSDVSRGYLWSINWERLPGAIKDRLKTSYKG